MSQTLSRTRAAAATAARRRLLTTEGPVLAAIAVLLGAWLLLSVGG
jgi:hypothetical protein